MEAATNTDNDELIRTLGIAKREVQTLRSAAPKVSMQRGATNDGMPWPAFSIEMRR